MNLVERLKDSITKAEALDSKLSRFEYELVGMSGKKTRALLNNLCAHEGVAYLEVGMWRGSTFCSALKDNAIRATGVDNWCQSFNSTDDDGAHHPALAFMTTLPEYVGRNDIKIINGDVFREDVREKIGGGFNLYFYDGDHARHAQENAFVWLRDALELSSIVLVDDWSSEDVRVGTETGIDAIGAEIVYQDVLGYDGPGTNPEDGEGWWNGLFVAVLRKS